MEILEKVWPNRKRLGFLFLTILLCICGVYLYASDSIIKAEDLQIVDSLVINGKPAKKETNGKSSRQWIEFECAGISKKFEIDNFDYDCADKNRIIADLEIGDTISLKILKSDSENINKETFASKSNYVHSLIFKNHEYLNIDCSNEKRRDDHRFGYYLCFVLAALSLFMAVFSKTIFLDRLKSP